MTDLLPTRLQGKGVAGTRRAKSGNRRSDEDRRLQKAYLHTGEGPQGRFKQIIDWPDCAVAQRRGFLIGLGGPQGRAGYQQAPPPLRRDLGARSGSACFDGFLTKSAYAPAGLITDGAARLR